MSVALDENRIPKDPKKRFRIATNGVEFRIEIFRRPRFPMHWGEPRWRVYPVPCQDYAITRFNTLSEAKEEMNRLIKIAENDDKRHAWEPVTEEDET